jgi:hypothetical protein
MNEETYRQTLETEGGAPASKKGPQVYYGRNFDLIYRPFSPSMKVQSMTSYLTPARYVVVDLSTQHPTCSRTAKPNSYKQRPSPSPDLTGNTSRTYTWKRTHLPNTGRNSTPSSTAEYCVRQKTSWRVRVVLVRTCSCLSGRFCCYRVLHQLTKMNSCGMDASEHETPSMSRHNRRVPTSFFHRFARDACAFSDRYAGGKLISVLEGGYSDRALISGSMAHLSGLVDGPVDPEWWNVENLDLVGWLISLLNLPPYARLCIVGESNEEAPGRQTVTRANDHTAVARTGGGNILNS